MIWWTDELSKFDEHIQMTKSSTADIDQLNERWSNLVNEYLLEFPFSISATAV